MLENEVGWRLRDVRESRSLSRKDIEKMTHGEFKESILAMYENGRRRIPTPRLKRLSDFYGVSVAWLMGEAVTQSSNSKEPTFEALLMADPRFSEDERRLILDVLEIIRAKQRAEGRE